MSLGWWVCEFLCKCAFLSSSVCKVRFLGNGKFLDLSLICSLLTFDWLLGNSLFFHLNLVFLVNGHSRFFAQGSLFFLECFFFWVDPSLIDNN